MTPLPVQQQCRVSPASAVSPPSALSEPDLQKTAPIKVIHVVHSEKYTGAEPVVQVPPYHILVFGGFPITGNTAPALPLKTP